MIAGPARAAELSDNKAGFDVYLLRKTHAANDPSSLMLIDSEYDVIIKQKTGGQDIKKAKIVLQPQFIAQKEEGVRSHSIAGLLYTVKTPAEPGIYTLTFEGQTVAAEPFRFTLPIKVVTPAEFTANGGQDSNNLWGTLALTGLALVVLWLKLTYWH